MRPHGECRERRDRDKGFDGILHDWCWRNGTRNETDSEPSAKGKIELVALLGDLVPGDRNTKVETERSTGNKEPQTEPEIIMIRLRIEIIGSAVDEARII